MKRDGIGCYRLVRKPQAALEIAELVEAYVTDDDWEVETASESPEALTTGGGRKKRSGEYAITPLSDEVAQLKRECYR